MGWGVKLMTVVVVTVLLMNPETVQLAVFINAVGLDMFLLMVEVQVAALMMSFYKSKVAAGVFYIIRACFGVHCLPAWQRIKREPTLLLYSLPSAVSCIQLMVITFMLWMMSVSSIAWLG